VLRSFPGSAVGAAGAFTVGEKLLAPPGVMFFSVGDTEVVVVVVVLDGLGDSLPPHAAVSAVMAMMAAPPAITGRRRTNPDFMCLSYLNRVSRSDVCGSWGMER
jgi:hypothetical protein